jgi:hypothetical protein
VAFFTEQVEELLVVDVEAEGSRSSVKVRPVDKQGDLFLWVETCHGKNP